MTDAGFSLSARVLPFAMGDEAWKEKQIRDFGPQQLYAILIQAAQAYGDPRYADAAKKIPGFDPTQSALALRAVVEMLGAGQSPGKAGG